MKVKVVKKEIKNIFYHHNLTKREKEYLKYKIEESQYEMLMNYLDSSGN